MAPVSHLGYFGGRRSGAVNRFPARVLFAVLALLVFTAAAIVFGQTTGIGVVRAEIGAPQAIRDIVLLRAPGDVVVVRDAATAREIARYAPDTGGFVRGSLRALERMRLVANVPVETPWRLIRWDTGRVSLSDTATGERFYLEAFGRDNAAAFAALLSDQGGPVK